MRIQKLLAPNNNLKSLYIKELDELKREKEIIGDGKCEITFPITLKKGDIISFGTYVNALVLDKWLTLTKAENIAIVLRSSGRIDAQVYNSRGAYDWATDVRAAGKEPVEVKVSESKKKGVYEYTISLSDVNCTGVVYPIIEALEPCQFLGGEYVCDDVKGLEPIKPCYVINYNRDAKVTREGINAITSKAGYNGELIVVCDMTAELGENVFIDNTQKRSNIVQIATSLEPGNSLNKALDYIRNDSDEDYTHIIVIDARTLLDDNALARVFTFVSLLDDIRDNMIIQGDILSDSTHLESSGYLIRDGEPKRRYKGFDLCKSSDCVTAISSEEIDFFSFGLLCIPANNNLYFDPNIRNFVEFEYFLNNRRLEIASINGFFGYSQSSVSEGIIWTTYYKMRDYLIAIINSEYEMDRQRFSDYMDREIKSYYKKGGLELASAIIEAANDFLNGPEGLYDEYCLDEIKERLVELSNNFNQRLTSKSNRVKDRIELQKLYNKLYLKIDHDYDMIMGKWTESKRKVDDEREQQ